MKTSDLVPALAVCADVLETLDAEQRLRVRELASQINELFEGGDWPQAEQIWETAELTAEERIALWAFFGTRERAYLKGEDRKYLSHE